MQKIYQHTNAKLTWWAAFPFPWTVAKVHRHRCRTWCVVGGSCPWMGPIALVFHRPVVHKWVCEYDCRLVCSYQTHLPKVLSNHFFFWSLQFPNGRELFWCSNPTYDNNYIFHVTYKHTNTHVHVPCALHLVLSQRSPNICAMSTYLDPHQDT